MSEISVTHYLNKKLKPFFTGIENTYPVYSRILVSREVLRIKSPLATGDKIFSYFNETDFSNDSELKKTLLNETKLLKFIIKNDNLFKKNNISELVSTLNINICNEILNIDLHLSYFESFPIEDPNFFNIIKFYLSEYLANKSNIDVNFFLNNINIQNTSDYKKLQQTDFIKDKDIQEIYDIVIELREFEKLSYTIPVEKLLPYTSEKPLNIYEWFYNDGKQKFIDFASDKIKESKHFTSIINSIDYNCQIRIFDDEEI